MFNFRTKLLGLVAMAAVSSGMAYGQTGQAACAASAISNKVVRGESTNDAVGDLQITCTNSAGISAVAAGTLNVQLFFSTGVTVTSKVLDSTTGATEAVAWSGPAGIPPAAVGYSAATAVSGTIVGSTLNFVGIPTPALGIGTTQAFKVQISNIRVNASTVAVGTGAPPAITVTAVVSGAPVAQASLTAAQVGIIENALAGAKPFKEAINNTATAGSNNFVVCQSYTPGAVNAAKIQAGEAFTLLVTENFASGFRTQADEVSPILLGTSGAAFPANGPSKVTVATATNAADSGTRAKLVFTSVPANVTLYVPTSVTSTTATGAPNGLAKLQFTTAETGTFTVGTAATGLTNYPGNAGPLVAITPSGGTATAVFEVTIDDLNTLDSYQIPVFISTSGVVPSSTTPVSVAFSLAPTAGTTVPNFAATSATATTFKSSLFSACTTSLLFPFVTNQVGFDTGLSIANTSTDPFGTAGAVPQAGTCALNFYGASAPTAAVVGPNVATGTNYTFLLSSVAPGFQGYMIATCNFQYAHGFAFLQSAPGPNSVAEGYLGLVIPDVNQVSRAGGTGEVLVH